MSIIYGVDTTKEVTPLMVRDAIAECFYSAHCAQAEIGDTEKLGKDYCAEIVKKAFKETGGDFEQPTKASLVAALPWLADFSKSFRDQSVVQKHMGEIQKLMGFLK